MENNENITDAQAAEMLKTALVEGLPEDPKENSNSTQNKAEDTSKVEDSEQETPKADDSGNQQNDFLKTRNEILEKTALQKEQEIIDAKRKEELEQKQDTPSEYGSQEDDFDSKFEKKYAEIEAKKTQKEQAEKQFNDLVDNYIKANPDDESLKDDIKKLMTAHPTLIPEAAAVLARSKKPTTQNINVGNRSNPSLRNDKPFDKLSLQDMEKSPQLREAINSLGK